MYSCSVHYTILSWCIYMYYTLHNVIMSYINLLYQSLARFQVLIESDYKMALFQSQNTWEWNLYFTFNSQNLNVKHRSYWDLKCTPFNKSCSDPSQENRTSTKYPFNWWKWCWLRQFWRETTLKLRGGGVIVDTIWNFTLAFRF